MGLTFVSVTFVSVTFPRKGVAMTAKYAVTIAKSMDTMA
jgi:hypothetical protein